MNKEIVKRAFVNSLVKEGFSKEDAKVAFTKYGGNLLEILGGATLGGGAGYVGGKAIDAASGNEGLLPVFGALAGMGAGGYLGYKNEPSLEAIEEKLVAKQLEKLQEEQKQQLVDDMKKRYYRGSV